MEIQVAISPVEVWPSTASILRINSGGLGPPPSFHFRMFDADGELFLKQGSVQMTQAQWDDWAGQDDEEYITDCVLANTGLSRA